MRDLRMDRLANLLIRHSCGLASGEKVLIEAIGAPVEMVLSIIREARKACATPLVWLKDDRVIRELASAYDLEDVGLMADCELHVLKRVQAMISIRAIHNSQEYGDVPADRFANVLRAYVGPVHHSYRNEHLRWVALRWPTPGMAQRAGMSTEAFEDFFFEVCTIDYGRLERAMEPLARMLAETSRIRVVGPGDTDLSFSVKGIGVACSVGRHNLPDGEIFTAPVRDSVEGRIAFNVRSTFYGTTFSKLRLVFRKGRIAEAEADQSRRLNEILDQDDGARYLGEFALGLNPAIVRPMDDVLFDEKIAGSLHVAAGNAYAACDNGNRSAIHWDMVLLQTEEMGGGSVYFDDRLVRKNGMFVHPPLEALNPGRPTQSARGVQRGAIGEI